MTLIAIITSSRCSVSELWEYIFCCLIAFMFESLTIHFRFKYQSESHIPMEFYISIFRSVQLYIASTICFNLPTLFDIMFKLLYCEFIPHIKNRSMQPKCTSTELIGPCNLGQNVNPIGLCNLNIHSVSW